MIDEIVSGDVQRIISDVNTGVFKDKNILVTGGVGFIGSYLCDVFVELGASVTCLDDFSTGLIENIDHLFKRRNFKLIKEDVAGFGGEGKYDYILHFASRASPEDYQLHPKETLLATSIGSHRMLELARKHKSRTLFASSSEVYGNTKVIPTPETYWGNVNPVGPRSCYDEGKRFAEALFMAYYREYGVDVRIVRIHNTYGPRLRADGNYARALSRFIMQALKGENITVYGDGTQTRSFCYITDTTLGILVALSNERSKGEIFNIGSSDERTILQIAEIVKQLVGSRSKIVFESLPPDDPERRCPDVSKATQVLGWSPQVPLEEGLPRTIEWFRKKMPRFYEHSNPRLVF